MKKITFTSTALLITLIVFQSLAAGFSVADRPYLSKEFTLTGNGNLEVRTSGASVRVTGHEGNQVLVEMYVKRNGKPVDPQDAEVQKRLEDYKIDISKSSNKVSVIVERRKNTNWGNGNNRLSLSFDIQVPNTISGKFSTSGGAVAIQGVEGEQDFNTSGGSIKIQDCRGKVYARSSGGSFHVDRYNGTMEVQSSGGSVKLYNLTGALTVNSSGGSVHLDEVSGRIAANTSGGGIKANISTLDTELTLKSSGGSISAVVPKGLGMDLDLRGGRVNTHLTNFDGEVKKDKILGKMNGGGVLVTMASSGGSINLDYK
ncbi:hypothetical protein [Negadavirga shengliensis]|uniref:DUF4097 domain-containing protein n=1 Tax=Negadavirga shengliensis TaxID=1389218 RepID=A0ABV9T3I8_9BACT